MLRLCDIHAALGGVLHGDGTRAIAGLASLESAGPDRLAFVAQARHAATFLIDQNQHIVTSDGITHAIDERLDERPVVDIATEQDHSCRLHVTIERTCFVGQRLARRRSY